MDKRTILFVLALSLTLFGVNIYFERQNQDSLQTWNQQQIAKKSDKLKKLNQEIISRTVPLSTLPVVVLYADSEAKTPLATGVQSDKAILTLAWTSDVPQKAYYRPLSSKENLIEVTLSAVPENIGAPIIYQQDPKAKLRIGSLSEFGKYDLQLIVPSTEIEEGSITHFLGEYVDGRFEIPSEKIAQLQHDIDLENKISKPELKDALVLLKTGEKYLPVAIYQSEQKLLEPLEALPSLMDLTSKPKQKITPISNQKVSEKFYVLETPYQQLVFSNFGGALVEINLPFQSTTNKESVVKEIEFDRDMVRNHPDNAHFPAHAYFTPGSNPTTFLENKEGKLGGYYPLLRRDLIENDKRKSVRILPRYYALNIVSEYPEIAELVYEVKSFEKNKIVFIASQGHRRITKTFSVASEIQAPYTLDLSISVEGDARGLWLTSGIPEVEWISGAPAPALKLRTTRNQKVDIENLDLPKDSTTVTSAYPDWICNSNGFLGLIVDPLTEIDPGYRSQVVPGTIVPSRLVEIGEEYQRFNPQTLPGYMLLLPLKSGGGTMNFRIVAGPFSAGVLKAVDSVYSDPTTGYNPDYIACQSFHGWFAFISEPFAKFLFILLNFFHSMTHSWAFSIVLLTIALRVMLYPLNAWSTKSMVKMQHIAPEAAAIDEKYKKDPKKAQLEKMNLYRERGVNPVSGCLPILIQMPFLIGMFDLLKSTFELRGASFIPGWIDDLTAPDVLFSWERPLFFIGNQFHFLPILLGLVMFFQQRMMSPLPNDASLLTDQQRQQRMMGNMMTVVFAVMFYNFPSGLNIYWLSSMLLGMLQQWWTTRQMKATLVKEQAKIKKS
ncbi:MAG: membrane protein insertase YidC [Parachlamydiaceae bacterium]|nr:membrane protein insertase YidC [Parachlamydiaceae bacterium]